MAVTSGLLDGLRALVVGGGGKGIGAAITEGIAAAGADLAVVDVDADRAGAAADSAAKYGHKVGAGGRRHPRPGRASPARGH